MLTNTEILSWAAMTSYAAFSVNSKILIRPGQTQWEKRLDELTPDEHAALITKINRQQTRLRHELAARYGDNASSQSIQRLAKEDSMPASRRPAARRFDGR